MVRTLSCLQSIIFWGPEQMKILLEVHSLVITDHQSWGNHMVTVVGKGLTRAILTKF